MAHAEAVLLVDDDEPDVMEITRVLQQPVRADDDVDVAAAQTGHDVLDLQCRLETRQHLDAHGPVGETIAKDLPMLLREQRRGHQNGNLFAAVHRGERGTQRDFGFAKSDVATDDAIHRLIGRKVRQHIVNGAGLVFGQLERKTGFEAAVVALGPVKAMPWACGAARIDIEQLGGDVTNLLNGAPLCASPLIAAKPVQRGVFGRRTGVARNQVECMHRHIQLVAVRVLEVQEFGRDSECLERRQPEVTADAVFFMHNRRAGLEIAQLPNDRFRVAFAALPSPP